MSVASNAPKKILRMLETVEQEGKIGVFTIEIDERPEVMVRALILIREFFVLYGWEFHDFSQANGIIANIPEGLSLEYATQKSVNLQLGFDDGKLRSFVYEARSGNTAVAKLQTQSNDGSIEDVRDLSTIDQRTFAILASVWASPLLSLTKKIKKIGVLFDGATIDHRNWKATFDYLNELSTSEQMCVFLFVMSGRAGSNREMFASSVKRIGIYSPGVYTRINSYADSIEIVHRMTSSVSSSTPRIPLVFFLGAGASIEANFPSTTELMTFSMKSILRKPEESSIEYEDLLDELKRKIISEGHIKTSEGETDDNIHLSFERVMTEELDYCQHLEESPTLQKIKTKTSQLSPSSAHFAIAELAKIGCKPIVLTTNYDDLIERSFGKDSCKVFCKEADFLDPTAAIRSYLVENQSQVPIFKLHGSIDDFESIKASTEATRALGTNKARFLFALCNGDLFSQTIANVSKPIVRIIFIGYSFNDDDINNVLRSVLLPGNRLHLFAVTPCPTLKTLSYLRLASHKSEPEIINNDLMSIPFSIFAEEFLKEIKSAQH